MQKKTNNDLLIIFMILLVMVAGMVVSSCTQKKEVISIPGYEVEWSAKAQDIIEKNLDQLNLASADFEKRFCPNYSKLTNIQKAQAWGYAIGAITKFESNYKPDTTYKESDGSLSEGLFQLTYGNKFCPKSKSQGDLQDPLVNIDCGVRLFVHFVAMDKVVAAGGYEKYGAPPAKGAARYWAVIRVPDKKSKHHLAEIIAMTKQAPGCQ